MQLANNSIATAVEWFLKLSKLLSVFKDVQTHSTESEYESNVFWQAATCSKASLCCKDITLCQFCIDMQRRWLCELMQMNKKKSWGRSFLSSNGKKNLTPQCRLIDTSCRAQNERNYNDILRLMLANVHSHHSVHLTTILQLLGEICLLISSCGFLSFLHTDSLLNYMFNSSDCFYNGICQRS